MPVASSLRDVIDELRPGRFKAFEFTPNVDHLSVLSTVPNLRTDFI